MAEFTLDIYDLSGAFSEEGLSWKDSFHIGCRDVEGTNCYCGDEAREEILRRMPQRDESLRVSWIDTGDYHHLSRLTIGMTAESEGPLSVVLFDHHPDMQEPAFGSILSCGGWLRNLLEDCPHIGKAYVVGIDPALRSECEGFGDRVTVIDERQILDGQKNGRPCSVQLMEVFEGGKVFVSVDKDVLNPRWARTDWDHGTMDLDDILESLVCLSGKARIVGVDICGGITSAKGGSGEDFSLNRRTDEALLNLLKTLEI